MTKLLPTLALDDQHRSASGREQGFGSLATERGNLPLKRLEVQARLDGLVSTILVRQTFVNALQPERSAETAPGEALEATYIFPLPDRAAVTRFEMRVGQRLIEGVLRERGEARREYDAAIEKGHRAAIAEEDRSGVFAIRVGNILPGEEADVTLELTGPIPLDDGEATYQFPLVVAPRYIPGTPLSGQSVGAGSAIDTDAVPDASRLTPPVLLPGFPNPVELSLTVEIHDAGLPLRDFRSSLHAEVEENTDGVRRIALQAGERLNRDFLLRFKVGESSIHTAIETVQDTDGDGGTFQLTVVPPTGLSTTDRPRDVAFIFDRSGSMEGWKMVTARRALARMIDTLTGSDRFTVLAFDTIVETPPGFAASGLMPATDRQRYTAIEFLARLESRGGTEIAAPLQTAVDALATEEAPPRERIVVLLTDGQVGNEDEILRLLGPRLAGLRVFTLGIDRAVNLGFLQKLALLGGGYTEVVESEDRLDEVLAKIHRRIATPVLKNVRVELIDGQVEPESQTPRRLPDLFLAAPLVIRGRYRGAAPTAAAVHAMDTVGRPWSALPTANPEHGPAIRRLWARDQVRALEDEYAIGRQDQQNLSEQIVKTSLRFGVLSRFTAFVAVDRSEIVNAGGECRQILQPVEMPDGWDMSARRARVLGQGPLAFAKGCSAPMKDSRQLARRSGGALPLGKLRRVWESFMHAAPSEDVEATDVLREQAVVDLSAYRKRAAQLLTTFRQRMAASDVSTAWASLLVELESLVEDLASIGAPNAELQPLRTLLEEIRQTFAAANNHQPSTFLWQSAEATLSTFAQGYQGASADGSLATEASRREGFWK